MCAGDDCVRKACFQCFLCDVKALGAQLFEHVNIAVVSGLAKISHLLLQGGICDINVESDHMDLCALVFGGQLHAGNELDACGCGGLYRFGDAVCCVVIS